MNRGFSVLLGIISIFLFACGAVVGLTFRAVGVDSWGKFFFLASQAVFDTPDEHIKFVFDLNLLEDASLRSRRTAGLPTPSAVDQSIELLNDFPRNSRYRELARAAGVVRLNLVVEVDDEEQISPCTAFLIDVDKLLTAGHCLDPAVYRDAEKRTLIGSLRAGYFSKDSEGENVGADITVLEDGGEELDFAIIGINEEAASRLRDLEYMPGRLSRSAPISGDDLLVIHYPLGDVLHLSRRTCRVKHTGADLAVGEISTDYFEHSCGTLPGTSGAPIFDDRTLSVIGVHVRGDQNVIQINRTDGSGLAISALSTASPIIRSIIDSQEREGDNDQ